MRFDDYFDIDWVWGPWGGPSRRHRRRRRRTGKRFKWFERGDLKFAILALIEEKPMHGYEVMQALEEQSQGCYKASPGSIYPTLQLLEDQGYLKARDQDGKKVYTITDEGRDYLDENRSQVDDIFDRVSEFSDRLFGRDMAELSRAFSRLAQTTFQGAVGWIEDDDLMTDMKDILNRAVSDMDAAWDRAGSRRRREGRRSRGESEPEAATTASTGPEGEAADHRGSGPMADAEDE